MSSANLVPETWELTGSDAKETLQRAGDQALPGRVRATPRIRRVQPRSFDGLRHVPDPGARRDRARRSREHAR